MDKNNQLARLDSVKFVEIISNMPNLTEKDRNEIARQIASDDVELRKNAIDKMEKSMRAQGDMENLIYFQQALSKEGLYMTNKQTFETGSGRMEIQIKGGDRKLIIPVLIIVGVVIIAALVIVFWK
jgi:chromosome condensin MukBEF ATPase and DNA-binding subunit MukB